MAPIKYENDFKEKLDKRTITPSSEAWKKLSERLDAEEGTSNNKRFWWIGIAASIVGIFLVVSQFFNTDVVKDTPVIVDTPETIKTPNGDANTESVPLKENTIEITLENEAPISKEESIEIKTDAIKMEQQINTYEATRQIAQNSVVSKEREDKDVVVSKFKEALTFEAKKAQEVADAIFELGEASSGVSEASIDSLLKAAQRDILLNRMKNEDKVIVDAALLLYEVESELDQSFRDKVFKAIKESYGSVKTAIAQRND